MRRAPQALLRRLRNGWQGVRSEIERELAAEDIKRNIHDTAKQVDVREDVRSATERLRKAVSGEPGTPPSNEQH